MSLLFYDLNDLIHIPVASGIVRRLHHHADERLGAGFAHKDASRGAERLLRALDRIKGIEPMTDIPYVASDIDFDHYFDTIVGVTVPDDPTVQTIVFRTTEKRYPYIASKPLHPSQRIVDRKQCILQIEVAPNFELEQKLLSFGADIEVLAPEDLREQIKKKVEEAYKKYFAVQIDRTI